VISQDLGVLIRQVVFLERVHGKVIIRADGTESLLGSEPSVLGSIENFPGDVGIGIRGVIADAGASALDALTVGVNPRRARRMLCFAGNVSAVVNTSKIDRLAVVVLPCAVRRRG
jgi:hypothetical protein